MSTKWCADCLKGQDLNHNETPKGSISTIFDRQTYIAEPTAGTPPRATIIYLPDGGGFLSPNNRLLCDTYATKGHFRVLMPDFMDGIMVPSWTSPILESIADISVPIWTWPYKLIQTFWLLYGFVPMLYCNTFSKAWPKIETWLRLMRANPDKAGGPFAPQPLPLGLVGICWGGQFAIHLATGVAGEDGKPLVDVIFTAHPAGLTEQAKLKQIKLPISIAIGDEDMLTEVKKVHEAEAILRELQVDTELKIYEGAHHGFAVRIDKTNKNLYEQAVRAEDQCINWFEKHLL